MEIWKICPNLRVGRAKFTAPPGPPFSPNVAAALSWPRGASTLARVAGPAAENVSAHHGDVRRAIPMNVHVPHTSSNTGDVGHCSSPSAQSLWEIGNCWLG